MDIFGQTDFRVLLLQTTDDGATLDIYAAISLAGIGMFERSAPNQTNTGGAFRPRQLYAHFDWLEIENLCYSKRALCVVVRRPASLRAKDAQRVKYKLHMDGRKSFFAFTLASEHHKFYLKLRNTYTSLQVLAQDMNISVDGLPGNGRPPEAQTEVHAKPVGIAKASSNRVVRTFKKSMLNDNRLLRLRDKFLRRSKSSASGLAEALASAAPTSRNSSASASVEECQNKENECPTSSPMMGQPTASTVPTTPTMPAASGAPGTAKWISPSRNRVLMGTRAISKSYLNKSLDCIYDSVRESRRSGDQGRIVLRKELLVAEYTSDSDGADEGDDDDDEGLSSSSRSLVLCGGGRVQPDEMNGADEAYVIRKFSDLGE